MICFSKAGIMSAIGLGIDSMALKEKHLFLIEWPNVTTMLTNMVLPCAFEVTWSTRTPLDY